MGTVLQGLGVLMHDALHGSLFRRRRLDRLAAFLLGVCVLVPSAAFRVTHFRHHRYARGPLDPDELCNNVRAGWRLRAAFYVVMPLGLPVFLLHLATQGVALAGARERRAIFWQLAAMGMVYSSLFALPSAARPWIVHGWLFPLVASSVWVSLRNWSEHLCTDPGHPLTRSRTVTSNALTRFFLFNVNYHLEHHLFPAVPWYNLPQVHALLRPEYALAGANVCSSYLHFLGAAARGGVEAVVGADA
jgi:fatty acid desaturase